MTAAVVVCSRASGATPNAYVALGDSYTSAPFVSKPVGDPYDCGRSDRNYPHLVQNNLKYPVFRDVSCGSAETEDMLQPQGPLPFGNFNPPQFDALGPDVALVTIGIGGNDIGFGGATSECVQPPPVLGGTSCKAAYTAGGVDRISENIKAAAPKVLAVLAGIHERAPAAKVLLVGYPALMPEDGACWPYVPVLKQDAGWVSEKNRELNAMLAAQAAADGRTTYVDWYTPSLGHDMCKPPGVAWTNAVVVVPPSYPAHPNLLGTQGAADAVLRALGKKTTVIGTVASTLTLG